ncbi:MAG: hypothetical protein P4L40_16810 [Terracidiphilus sp.]|nr:hypothetical protein [Terracidiphilus sp.]
MGYCTRVISKDEEYPEFEELAQWLRAEHPDYRLMIEENSDEGWQSLLLVGDDDVEVALLERNLVYDGSHGQDEIADLMLELEGAMPETGVAWLTEFLESAATIYTFQHLQGADTVDGSNALHALRNHLWERGDSIIQADMEGFTNEDGFHIVWQFADTVSGPWNMGVLQDGTWYHFKMDLGDPDHRAAFLRGEVPDDLTAVRIAGSGA